MNVVISILPPEALPRMTQICQELDAPVALALYGRGTATRSMRDMLGIESREKRIVFNVLSDAKTEELIRRQKECLYIEILHSGLVIAVPVKSVGGGRVLSYLTSETPEKSAPATQYDYELIVVIAAEGCTDTVMEAARAAGAGGGTVLHAKGTGNPEAARFYNLSIAQEKELIYIVSPAADKARIMKAIVEQAGPGTDAGSIVFSLPVSAIAGLGLGGNAAKSPAEP